MSLSSNRFPPGWSEARVQRLLAHYEQQTEAQAVAEDEAAAERADQTFIQVPRDLLPQVRDLIARRQVAPSPG
jgi:hypothetical protein